jgi:hypothetical protein
MSHVFAGFFTIFHGYKAPVSLLFSSPKDVPCGASATRSIRPRPIAALIRPWFQGLRFKTLERWILPPRLALIRPLGGHSKSSNPFWQ